MSLVDRTRPASLNPVAAVQLGPGKLRCFEEKGGLKYYQNLFNPTLTIFSANSLSLAGSLS